MVSASSSKKKKTEMDLGELTDLLKDRLNLALICISHSWGGLEQTAAADAVEVGKLGLKVRMICLPGTPIFEYLSRHKEYVTIHTLSYHPRDYFDFKFRNELHSLIEREDTNIFHTHQTTLLGSILPWFWNRPDRVVCASRHMMNNHDKRGLFHSLLYRRLDAMVVMSEALKKNVLETHPLRERQVKVIHLGLDFKQFDRDRVDAKRQRAEWGADDKTLVIGMVGRLDPAKGQATFIKAAASLSIRSDAERKKIKFVIVGEETRGSNLRYIEELQELIRELKLEDQITLAGFKENIPEVMSAFDVFVMPSRQEAFGLVAIEAMAMECPIVISRGGSSHEIVGDQEFGLLVRPNDAFDLQRQLSYLIDHPDVSRKMGERAREHVKAHYDRKVRLEKTLRLYDRYLRIRQK